MSPSPTNPAALLPTPRTDLAEKFGITGDSCNYVHMDFARQLERELIAATTPQEEPASVQEADGCPTEKTVLARFWRAHQSPPLPVDVAEMVEQPDYFDFLAPTKEFHSWMARHGLESCPAGTSEALAASKAEVERLKAVVDDCHGVIAGEGAILVKQLADLRAQLTPRSSGASAELVERLEWVANQLNDPRTRYDLNDSELAHLGEILTDCITALKQRTTE